MSTDIGRRVRRIVTTEELRELLVAGKKVRLRPVARPSEAVLEHYGPADLDNLGAAIDGAVISSVEHVRDEQVQCIAVDHPDHLYLTDAFIPTHNTSNIVFLKSTDDSMIETLQKMSGTTHRSYTDSKTVTQDKEKMFKGLSTEGKVSYTMTTKEEPVIKYNDMAFISERNSIIFRAGDPPVWNRNETILPMSWRLFKDTIIHPGHDYSLQTIPTLSSALDFDVRQNQPNFTKMLDKRMRQAERAAKAQSIYRKAYGYEEFDVERLDPDVYSDEVMSLITSIVWESLGIDPEVAALSAYDDEEGIWISDEQFERNDEVITEIAARGQNESRRQELAYAGGTISVDMLVGKDRSANHQLDKTIIGAYQACKSALERDMEHFSVRSGTLCGTDGTPYLSRQDESDALRAANRAAGDPGMGTFAEEDVEPEDLHEFGTFVVHDAFLQFLADLPHWRDLGQGSFEKEMSQRMKAL